MTHQKFLYLQKKGRNDVTARSSYTQAVTLSSVEIRWTRFFLLCVAVAASTLLSAAQMWSQTLSWGKTLNLGNLDKAGLGGLDASNYQYEIIGLGGTTLRVGPYGFTSEGSPDVLNPSGCQYHPYLAYEYWWDEKSHRQEPFAIFGGYMTTSHNIELPFNGQITSFNHHLDIRTGILSINLGLTLSGTTFTSRRTEFVTPAGVWVIQVSDSGATKPFALTVNPTVDVVDSISYSFSSEVKTNGIVITGTAPNTSTPALAVAWDSAVVVDTVGGYTLMSNTPDETLTFYIAPASSYAPKSTSPADVAWDLASSAEASGYAGQLQTTQGWWNAYWAQHEVDLPTSEDILAKWYARSLYYHGVYFGNTDIPPGIWGTSAFPGGGAICPEFDLPFSQLAMLYTNHIAESAKIVDWIKSTLSQAERNAMGTTLYNVSVHHNWGALFGWWVGYDGKYIVPGTAPEGSNLYEDFPSANCAEMAVKHADFTLDPNYIGFADTILVQTTKVQVDDQSWNGSNYVNVNSPSSMNQDGCLFGLSELVDRNLADSAWSAMLPRVLLPKGIWIDPQGHRDQVLVGSVNATPSTAGGDAPQLDALWWYGIVKKSDPVLPPTFALISLSNTAAYVFNRGTMSVAASKQHDWSNAYEWGLSLAGSDVTYDDATISEMVHDAYDFQRTPEIAAHGALICSVVQMLVDPDNNDPIEVFPAIPMSWWASGVSFKNILVKGGIEISGGISSNNITITVANNNSEPTKLNLRVWLPPGTTSLSQSPDGTVVTNGYANLNDTVEGNSDNNYVFAVPATIVKKGNSQKPIEFALSQNYPNPFNPSTEIGYSIPKKGFVTLKVYNLLGQKVATLVNQEQEAGNYSIIFNADKLGSGVYIYRIKSGALTLTKKMTFQK